MSKNPVLGNKTSKFELTEFKFAKILTHALSRNRTFIILLQQLSYHGNQQNRFYSGKQFSYIADHQLTYILNR